MLFVATCAGALVAANAYDAWGIPAATNIGRLQYTGQAFLPELGMYHYKARIYSPTLGRFLQTDPVGYDDQINLYAYVANDPVNHGDPSGMCADDPCFDRVAPGAASFGQDHPAAAIGLFATMIGGAVAIIAPEVAVVAGALMDANALANGEPVAGGTATGAAIGQIERKVGNLPKPPTGPGSVPRAQRDPTRSFSLTERAAKREAQGNQCATGCGKKIDQSNSEGHHIERHADGGRTNSENHAEVCKDCHRELHKPD